MSLTIQRYGWVRDLPDQRDYRFSAPLQVTTLPPSVDLTSACPPVYDQGQLGSCTANAIAAALEFDQMKENQSPVFVPSRLFIYYNERVIEGTVRSDSGAQIRDGMKSVANQGACSEDMWPYDLTKWEKKPSHACYQNALSHNATTYQSLTQNIDQMKGCLASGYPFVFGFTVYESFESDQVAQTGHVPMPQAGEKVLGGHAVLAVGYDDANQWFIVRNSWGSSWGMKGYFTMPYAYLLDANLSSDFWMVQTVH